MKIAYTKTDGQGELDLLLANVADQLETAGLRTMGIVQINSDREDCHRCDMDVQVLSGGPKIRISQNLGKESRGCRLNPEAMAEAVSAVAARMENGYDIFILNKFGKHEADGKGFRELIGDAAAAGAIVIAGTNGMNEPAFLEFSGGLAEFIEPDESAIMSWINTARASEAA